MTSRAALIAILLLLAPQAGLAITPVTMNKDLYADFACKTAPGDAAFDAFLTREKFHVFDEGRLLAQHHQSSLTVDIMAYDARRWTISLMTPQDLWPSTASGLYTIIVESPPPTRHDTALEDRIVVFVEQDLHCKITFQTRGENPASMADFFDFSFGGMKKQEAYDVCRRPAYDGARCAALPVP